MKMEVEEQTEIVQRFVQEKGEHQAYWGPIWNDCQAQGDFVFGGQQFKEGEMAGWGISKPHIDNLLLNYINHEANKTLLQKYRAIVNSNGGGSDMVKARELEQILRGIQVHGGAAEAYNKARRGQLGYGVHFTIPEVKYQSGRGPQKKIVFTDIADFSMVLPDKDSTSLTFADSERFFIKQMVSYSRWKAETGRNPDEDGLSKGSKKEIWHYWTKHEEMENEYYDEEWKGVLESALPQLDPTQMDSPDMPFDMTGLQMNGEEPFMREGAISKTYWKWCKIVNDSEVVDSEIFKTKFCPLVGCIGRKYVNKAGKVQYQSLGLFAQVPQREYTIINNIILLQMAKSPYKTWKIAYESIKDLKGLEDLRRNAVIGDTDQLYNARDEQGRELPVPQSELPQLVDPRLVELRATCVQEMERIMGIFDSNLGRKDPTANSGIAKKIQNQEGDEANYDLAYNYLEYVKQINMVVLDLIPNYLTAQQEVAMLDKDDKPVMKIINSEGGIRFSPDEEYGLVIEVEPDSDTAREKEAENLQVLMQNNIIATAISQSPKRLSYVFKAQKSKWAQMIGDDLEQQGSVDPQKQQMQKVIQDMQVTMQKLSTELKDAKSKTRVDLLKESNRHLEAIVGLNLDADKLQLDHFKVMNPPVTKLMTNPAMSGAA